MPAKIQQHRNIYLSKRACFMQLSNMRMVPTKTYLTPDVIDAELHIQNMLGSEEILNK